MHQLDRQSTIDPARIRYEAVRGELVEPQPFDRLRANGGGNSIRTGSIETAIGLALFSSDVLRGGFDTCIKQFKTLFAIHQARLCFQFSLSAYGFDSSSEALPRGMFSVWPACLIQPMNRQYFRLHIRVPGSAIFQ